MQNKVQQPTSLTQAPADPAGIEAATSVHPNPEVVAKAKRRRFTAKYKQQILKKADDMASEPGGVGTLLRREGLYSSHLVVWRRQREVSIEQGLEPRKRGPKSGRSLLGDANQKLVRENERLTERLRKAELIIDVQKKLAALLGTPIMTEDPKGSR